MTFSVSGAAPTPLYQQYQDSFGLTPFLLTVIFATYLLSLLLALLRVGSTSDHFHGCNTMTEFACGSADRLLGKQDANKQSKKHANVELMQAPAIGYGSAGTQLWLIFSFNLSASKGFAIRQSAPARVASNTQRGSLLADIKMNGTAFIFG